MGKRNLIIKDIRIEELQNKPWCVIEFENGCIWVPALAEQAVIAQKVIQCEKVKYKRESAEKMPIEFIYRAMKGENICALCNKFKLTHTRAYKKFCIEKGNKIG